MTVIVGGRLVLLYIHYMNLVNSCNDCVMTTVGGRLVLLYIHYMNLVNSCNDCDCWRPLGAAIHSLHEPGELLQ